MAIQRDANLKRATQNQVQHSTLGYKDSPDWRSIGLGPKIKRPSNLEFEPQPGKKTLKHGFKAASQLIHVTTRQTAAQYPIFNQLVPGTTRKKGHEGNVTYDQTQYQPERNM